MSSGRLPGICGGDEVFARPSLRSRHAGSGAEHPSNMSGGRSGARHSEGPDGLRHDVLSKGWSLAAESLERSRGSPTGNISSESTEHLDTCPGSGQARLQRNGAGCPMEWTPGLRFPDTKLLVTGSLVRVALLRYVLTVPDCGHRLRAKVAGAAFLVCSIVLLRRRTMLTASMWMLRHPLQFFPYWSV